MKFAGLTDMAALLGYKLQKLDRKGSNVQVKLMIEQEKYWKHFSTYRDRS